MQAKRLLFAWHSHKVVVFCSCAVFRCLTMQLALVRVTRERGAPSHLRWWPREGVHWWLQVRKAVWYAPVGAATVLVGIPFLRAANRLKLQRHTFISQTYATTPPLTSSTHSSQLSPLFLSLQMAFRRVLGAPALGAAARCAVTTTPRAWQSKVRCVSLPSPSISTMSGVS
jgi:hypothetical protein